MARFGGGLLMLLVLLLVAAAAAAKVKFPCAANDRFDELEAAVQVICNITRTLDPSIYQIGATWDGRRCKTRMPSSLRCC